MEKIVNFDVNKENILEDFSNCFVNNPPTKCFVELDKAKRSFNSVTRTAKAGKILGVISLTCIPLTFTLGSFDERILACLGIACFATMASSFSLLRYSKKKHNEHVGNNISMDFMNYSIYKQNETFKKLIESSDSNQEKENLVKTNLFSLLEAQDLIIDHLKASEIVFDDLYEIYEGNLNDVIKKRDFELTKIYNVYDYISKHIADNANLYSTFAPEYQQNIKNSIELTKEVDKIGDEYLSQNYIDKRRDTAYYYQLKKNFPDFLDQFEQ